jgi:cell fate regulator YaaT (PSP1 superfamily)
MNNDLKHIQRGLKKITVHSTNASKQELMSCCKMSSFSYIEEQGCLVSDLTYRTKQYVEVRFKNNRKEFFELCHDMGISVGDIVALESSPGHDVGVITLMGYLATRQMKCKSINLKTYEIKKVYRKAKTSDIQRWMQSIDAEPITLKRTRRIILDLKLQMKLIDVEYQGDGSKAIFYYTSDDRVDFRELIKVLAREFRIRVEMKQIGSRQESSRLGGIGPCGRELCCSSWINDFQSVSTQAARTQQIALNPQKLAGQCTKLKCCLNYEFPVYLDALKKFPDTSIALKTKKGKAFHIKSDIFKNLMWYAYADDRSIMLGLSSESVNEIIHQNNKKIFPPNLEDFAKIKDGNIDIENSVDQEDIKKMGLTDEQ